MATYALVADVGGTQMRAAVVDGDARISHRQAVRTLAQEGKDASLGRLLELLKRVKADADSCAFVGVCVPGPVDPEQGILYNPPNLPGWDRLPLARILGDELGLPAFIGNDANLAALAEQRYGAGKGYRHVIYMTISTGIGGGLVIDGKLYEGRKGFAGEVGHMTIEPDGPRCGCGNTGCLEALASGTAVARMARERLASGESSMLRDMVSGDLSELTADKVAEAARAGDGLAQAVMRQAGESLGIGIVNLMHIFDPEVIVIGGGMSNSLDMLMPEIERVIDERAMGNQKGRRPVVKSALGDDVSLLGAAALAFSATAPPRRT